MFSLRFDMRAPGWATPPAQLYPAALDMAAYAENRGLVMVTLSEHHASDDGFLPSPLTMAAALAARTESVRITVAAVLLPLHNPVRLAEDIAVLDLLSGGRVSYTMGVGYRPAEFESLGVPYQQRGALADEYLDVVLRALAGESFEYRGRTVQVRPTPARRVRISYGGKSIAAARRAARFGLDFNAQNDLPEIASAYREECARRGKRVGRIVLPRPGAATTVFVADDLDRAWDELGPHLLHDAMTYAEWHDYGYTVSLSHGRTVDELRTENGAHRIYTVAQAIAEIRQSGFLSLHPLCGGLHPELAWPYLRRVVEEVLPAVAGDAKASTVDA
jgi:alkanesulfonate monooxygenase SsuD/methylene tetrahydromethanopterin reductase-like flavin-dependent oxidoreductase (luciferase family)